MSDSSSYITDDSPFKMKDGSFFDHLISLSSFIFSSDSSSTISSVFCFFS